MRICIPTKDESGLEARAYNHFGSTPFFTVVDTETLRVEVVPNSDTGHGHGRGTCRPLRQANLPAFDAVVCRSMGRRALATLVDEGVEVFITKKNKVQEIVEAVKAGQTTRLSSLDACSGHGQGDGHGDGPGRGQHHGPWHGRGGRA